MADILVLTADDLQAGVLRELIPEFYDQAAAIENSPWHVQQPVLDHVIKVYRSLAINLEGLGFIDEPQRQTLRSWLGQPVGHLTRHQVLFWITLLHDIAKPETLVVNDQGIAYCPGHELKGAVKAATILQRIKDQVGLSDADIQVIVKVIKFHGEPHRIIDSTKPVADLLAAFADYQQAHPDIFIYLMLFAMADTQGSTLDVADPQELGFRVNVYLQVLNTFHL